MKQYNGEKAIISLTSWKARIKTVGKTLYNLIKMCPGFHIVLVLSEEEFPKKEKELPEELMLFVDNDLIEILWVYKNYKAFKKVLFTMDKYRDVPVISADDDCIYLKNYAQEFYDVWVKNKDCFITYWCNLYNKKTPHTAGYATLHPPYIYGDVLSLVDSVYLDFIEDDNLYTAIRRIKGLNKYINLDKKMRDVAKTHNETGALYKQYNKNGKTETSDFRINKIYNYIINLND